MMRRRSSPLALILVVLLLLPGLSAGPGIRAQDAPGAQQTGENGSDENGRDENGNGDDETQVPLPYEREEFPEWAWDVRRGEIIAFGAFPLAMIISGIGLQLGRFTAASVREGGFSQENAPFFLSTRTGPRYDENERIGLLISAGVISVGVALVDYFLGRREQRNR